MSCAEPDPNRCLCGHPLELHHDPDPDGLTWCKRCSCSLWEQAEKYFPSSVPSVGGWAAGQHSMTWIPEQ